MKKIVKVLGALSLVIASFTSCERDISALNIDPKNTEIVQSQNLVSTVSYYLANAHVSASVNENITRFFTQQWTETTYTSETNYFFEQRNQNQSYWNNTYREVIGPLAKAKTFLAKELENTALTPADQAKIKVNKNAVLEILSIYAWATLVDSYGDVPYSEALKSDLSDLVLQPKYDDAATIYSDLITRINAVEATIDENYAGYGTDPFYHGDMSKWKKVLNTIKLRMGLNLADTNAAQAKSLVESAYAGGVITEEEDNFQFQFDNALFSNPVYLNLVANGRNDFLPSNIYVNFLKNTNDPRRIQYFAENLNIALGTVANAETIVGTGMVITFEEEMASLPTVGQALFINNNDASNGKHDDEYIGTVIAAVGKTITVELKGSTPKVGEVVNVENYKGGNYGLLNTYANFTRVTDRIKERDAAGQIFDHVNVKFMLAEAAARGYSVGGTAAGYYATAVTASMEEWDVHPADAAAFLLAHPYDATNWQKSIGEAAWIAMYNEGFEAWYFWRRLDYPVLSPAPTAVYGLVRRMPYPLNEKNNNAANVAAASTKIPGGDIYSSKVFWDKN